jgi:hypothetical protein
MGKAQRARPAFLIAWALAVFGFGLSAVAAGSAQAQSLAAFTAHYEHLAQIETELLAKAQALPPAASQRRAAVAAAVATLNSDIASLYTANQALAAQGARPLPPQQLKAELTPALEQARAALGTEIRACNRAPGAGAVLRARLLALAQTAGGLQQRIIADARRLNMAARRPAFGRSAQLESDAMQAAIIQIQSAAVSLTSAWLALSGTGGAGGEPHSITGLAYTAASIAVPVKGQPPVTDTVGAQPKVTDGAGRSVPDTGTYRLRGPGRFHGVSVDRLIGTVTVRHGATPGLYIVTYSQGQASEQVSIQVTP